MKKKTAWIIAAVLLLALAATAVPTALQSRNSIPNSNLEPETTEKEEPAPAEKETLEAQMPPESDEPDTIMHKPEVPEPADPKSTFLTESTPNPAQTPAQNMTNPPELPPEPPPEPEPAPSPRPAPSFDAGAVCSGVRAQAATFMTNLDGPSNGMGYVEYRVNASNAQDSIISELTGALQAECNRGNLYFDIAYARTSGGYHYFLLYRAM